MMTLTELLGTQKELNSHCEGKPTQEQLLMAIVAECGELAQALKGDWCWWKRNGKGFEIADRDTIAAELADILCFLLTGFGLYQESVSGDSMCGETFWDRQWGFVAGKDKLLVSADACLIRIQVEALSDYYSDSLRWFVMLCAILKFTQAEIEAAYLRKVAVNKARWA